MPDLKPLTARQRAAKRAFDIGVAGVLLVVTSPALGVAVLMARWSTGASGIYRQQRVGRDGELFEMLKVRSMRPSADDNTVTAAGDARVTRVGAALRSMKLDELPQLFSVLRGDMSMVGPRPDVPGFADRLTGNDRVILTLRPGITGPASIAFRHEEALLAAATDPEEYNRAVLWPEKVRLNRDYLTNWSLVTDIRCLLETVQSVASREEAPA